MLINSRNFPLHRLIFYIFLCISVIIVALTLHLRYTDASKKTICKDCNVLMVSIDSCSAQNMPCYGYPRNTTKNFCALADKSQFFLSAYANAPWTLPSRVSMFTGLYPSHHLVNHVYTDPLSPSIPLLSDIFLKNGYEAIFYMPKNNEILSDTIIYNRGNPKIIDNTSLKDDGIQEAIADIKENTARGKKTFLSLYSQQCHYPYLFDKKEALLYTNKGLFPEIPISKDVDIPFTKDFYLNLLEVTRSNMRKSNAVPFYSLVYNTLQNAGSYEAAKIAVENIYTHPDFNHTMYLNLYLEFFYSLKTDPHDTEQMKYIQALYDQVLERLDRTLLSRIYIAVQEDDLFRNTILLITSEHGEEFGEHGNFGHTSLYDRNLHIPFLLYIPNIPPKKISATIQGTDIMPTLLDLADIKHSFLFDGVSLVPYIEGKQITDRFIVADNYLTDNTIQTIKFGQWKVFISKMDNNLPFELYNIKRDPMEIRSVLPDHFDEANAILESYAKQYAR